MSSKTIKTDLGTTHCVTGCYRKTRVEHICSNPSGMFPSDTVKYQYLDCLCWRALLGRLVRAKKWWEKHDS
jgi:hypothetical protein